MDKSIKVGLIEKRHDMPVEDYLITETIKSDLLKKDNLIRLQELITINIVSFIKRNPNKNIIKLYLTGISRVQHLIIRLLVSSGFVVEIWDFDKESETYFLITTYRRDEK